MKIGAHVSTADAVDRCVDRICDIGGEAIQIFASAPQSWRVKEHTPEAMALLQQRASECGVLPAFVHAIYLINLATADPAHLERSIGALAGALRFCEAAGCAGAIFHVGSHKGLGSEAVLPQIVQAMQDVLERAPGESWLILENSAGMGNTLAARFDEIGRIVREVGSPRVKVCLDTCHAFASGYDLGNPAGVEAMIEEFERLIGIDRLVAVHANDSKGPLGSGKDRHENIGEGFIGLDGFRAVMAHQAFFEVPFLLEVPGFDGKGPDARNVTLLKQIREEVCGR